MRKRMFGPLLAAGMLSLLAGCGGGGEQKGASEEGPAVKDGCLLRAAFYPEQAPYPDEADYTAEDGSIEDAYYDAYDLWAEENRAGGELLSDYDGALTPFFEAGIRQFLTGGEGENQLYAPLNVYMALGMLAETTEAESRAQILDLLGADSLETLREQTDRIWQANYCNDGATTSILAGSLWLNEKIAFRQETLDVLADHYHASSYQGVMGSDELNRALQTWLDEQTGGLLGEQAAGEKLDADTVLALAATVNFHARWNEEFWAENTQSAVFHGADGDVTCDFMHQDGETYYRGTRFAAVPKALANGGAMWFFLPDEGVTAEELLADDEMTAFLLGSEDARGEGEYVTVHLAVPKFDVSSEADLTDGLKALGVTDVFDPDISDFSPLTTDAERLCVSKADHAVRVKIDEEGCTAAAYTVMAIVGAAMPPAEEVDFVLDRPFVFAVTGNGGLPLFVGIVNQPAGE